MISAGILKYIGLQLAYSDQSERDRILAELKTIQAESDDERIARLAAIEYCRIIFDRKEPFPMSSKRKG